MRIALRPRPYALVLVFVLAAAGLTALGANPAQAQEPTGAAATKDCPNAPLNDPYTLGDTVTCTFTVENLGFFPADVTALTEQSPFPGGPVGPITCSINGTEIATGDVLDPNTACAGSFDFTIPNDPTLCNSLLQDQVHIELAYPQFDPPLTAGAFATHELAVVCPPAVAITATASALSKVGDDVTYTIEVCNTGLIAVTRDSVIDTLLGDISGNFDATLAPGACASATLTRTVLSSDPDPLLVTATATYSGAESSVTVQVSADTELFQPGVDVSKSCTPDPVEVGAALTCTIVVTNTSSADAPGLVNGTIVDTLTGNLLDPTNTAVASSDCTAALPTGGSCTIVTNRTVLDTDPDPLVNTVTVHYNPEGFTNDIADTAQASVTPVSPPEQFSFGGVVPVCIGDAPYIQITFGDRPDLDGHAGTLSFFDVNNTFIEERPLTFQSGETVNLIYPGAEVDADGNAVDWPGWVLNEDGLWVPDPTDAIWRDGLNLVYEVNPTATAFVAYPPATAACASPENPPPSPRSSPPVASPPSEGSLPFTGGAETGQLLLALLSLAIGGVLTAAVWRRRAPG